MRSIFPMIESDIQRICASEGAQLWGMSVSRGRTPNITVFIEGQNSPTTLDLCAKVSRHLGEFFVDSPPVAGSYTLEVSSPGMDRYIFTLTQFKLLTGAQVRIKLLHLVENRRWLRGDIGGVCEKTGVVHLTGSQLGDADIDFDNIDWARLVPDFASAPSSNAA